MRIDGIEFGSIAPRFDDEGPQVNIGTQNVRAPGQDQLRVAELFGFSAIAETGRVRQARATGGRDRVGVGRVEGVGDRRPGPDDRAAPPANQPQSGLWRDLCRRRNAPNQSFDSWRAAWYSELLSCFERLFDFPRDYALKTFLSYMDY